MKQRFMYDEDARAPFCLHCGKHDVLGTMEFALVGISVGLCVKCHDATLDTRGTLEGRANQYKLLLSRLEVISERGPGSAQVYVPQAGEQSSVLGNSLLRPMPASDARSLPIWRLFDGYVYAREDRECVIGLYQGLVLDRDGSVVHNPALRAAPAPGPSDLTAAIRAQLADTIGEAIASIAPPPMDLRETLFLELLPGWKREVRGVRTVLYPPPPDDEGFYPDCLPQDTVLEVVQHYMTIRARHLQILVERLLPDWQCVASSPGVVPPMHWVLRQSGHNRTAFTVPFNTPFEQVPNRCRRAQRDAHYNAEYPGVRLDARIAEVHQEIEYDAWQTPCDEL